MSRRIELRKRQLRGDDSLLRKRDDKQIGGATEFRLRKKKKEGTISLREERKSG